MISSQDKSMNAKYASIQHFITFLAPLCIQAHQTRCRLTLDLICENKSLLISFTMRMSSKHCIKTDWQNQVRMNRQFTIRSRRLRKTSPNISSYPKWPSRSPQYVLCASDVSSGRISKIKGNIKIQNRPFDTYFCTYKYLT